MRAGGGPDRGTGWGPGGSPPQPAPAQHWCLCSSFSVTSDPKEEGLGAQISRLAELIGRLESKVRSLTPTSSPHSPAPGRAG